MGFFLTAQKPRGGSVSKPSSRRASRVGGKVPRAPREAKGGKDKTVIPLRVLGRTQYAGACKVCPLNASEKTLSTPKMAPEGSDDPYIYVLGESPTQVDDEQGAPFSDHAGDYLRNLFPAGLDPHIRWSNAIKCKLPASRSPTSEEVACCSSITEDDIEASQPLVVMGFGTVPLQWVVGVGQSLVDWRGQLIPIQVGSHKCWFAPMYHPGYVKRMKKAGRSGEALEHTFKRDLKRVIDLVTDHKLTEPWIPEGEELSAGMHWELSYDLNKVKEHLAHMLEMYPEQSVDIETNMIRPYAADSKILTLSFGTWESSYAIPIRHRESKWTDAQLVKLWKIIGDHLRSLKKAICHHAKFEAEWLSMPFALGKEILFEVAWEDTMAQAHVLSTQSLTAKSLNSRCIAVFGVPEKTLDDVDRARLDFVDLPKVLRYNARDTKFTHKLWDLQLPLVKKAKQLQAYRRMTKRVASLALAQQLGVLPDYAEAARLHKQLQTEIESIDKKISAIAEVKNMIAQTGAFNSSSAPQLVVLLRDKLKLKEGWRKVDGVSKYSTDEEVLSRIKHPIGKLIMDRRGLIKLDSTYVIGACMPGAFPIDVCGKLLHADHLIHTNYNYLKVTTGRLSSDDPNLQNFPKRERKDIRNVICAPEGHWMVSIDYGQIEARVIAIMSQCPVMMRALWEHYDIHMDWAKIISAKHEQVMVKYLKEAKGDETKAMKLFRSDIKNQWTFPLFFGSVLPSVAEALGLTEKQLKPQFNQFWEMFEAVKRWQEKLLAEYKERGYVATLTGRRRYEPLSTNEIFNSPVQGTASDIVVDSQDRLARMAYETKRWQLAPRMNVHDDLTFYFPEESIEEDIEDAVCVMAQPEFDFINVPITVEVSAGKRWGDQEELATVESTKYGYPQIRSPR